LSANSRKTIIASKKVDVLASIDDIKQAIENLSSAELLRLEKYSQFRIRGLGRKAGDKNYEDLLKEAMTATLTGTRRWKKNNINFITHLLGAIRSISSHWREQATPDVYGESEYSLQNTVSELPSVERVFSAKERLARIYKRFEKDPDVLRVISGMKDGMSGMQSQAAFGLSKNDYESALRRLRRGLLSVEE
jgi:hypothetical protein